VFRPVGLGTAALTAFDTVRAYFMTFWGELKVPPEASQHGHGETGGHDQDAHAHTDVEPHQAPGQGGARESPPVMTIPLMILAVFAVGVGFVLGPLTGNGFARYLGETLTERPYNLGAPVESLNWLMMGISSVIALGGIGL